MKEPTLLTTFSSTLCTLPCIPRFASLPQAMSQGGTWGDELTLRAACDSYGVVVHCVTSEAENW